MVLIHKFKRGRRKVPLGEKLLPQPTLPYTGGELITKRFSLLCKKGLG